MGAATVGGAALIGACAPQVVENTVKETVEVPVQQTVIITQPAAKKVTIRILTRSSNPDNPTDKVFIEALKQFQTDNPDITLQDLSVSDEGAHDTKFKTSIAAGTPIEVFDFLGYPANLDYVKNGVVTDITKVLEDDKAWSGPYNKQSMFDPVKYDNFGIKGIYGVPVTPYGVGMYYNKKIFDDLGLSVPVTWEEVIAAAPKLIEKGITPVPIGEKDTYRAGHFLTALAMKKYGPQLKDDLISGKEKWNGDSMLGLIQYIQDLYDKGIFGKDNLSYNGDGESSMLEKGKAAMMFQGTWTISTINAFSNVADITVKGFPYLKDYPQYKDMWMGGPSGFLSMSVKPGDEKFDAAVKVLKYFTSVDYFVKIRDASKGGGVYALAMPPSSQSDRITTEFNTAFNASTNMIGEIEQYSMMAPLMDTVRNEVQTIFSGDNAKAIADRIQKQVDTYNANN